MKKWFVEFILGVLFLIEWILFLYEDVGFTPILGAVAFICFVWSGWDYKFNRGIDLGL